MNKLGKRLLCLLLAAATTLPLVGCGDDSGTPNPGTGNGGGDKVYQNDPETRPVVFATDALDGNFNPFFATSAPDSKIANMTQLGMLTTDDNGNVVSGEDQPTVVLTHSVKEGPNQSYTDYEFVIKNGIKFSNGANLTIKDVLFNLYVYLDPSYMGSATMYSTDIQGLEKYRTQDPSIAEGSGSDAESEMNAGFLATALSRIDDMKAYLDTDSSTNPDRAVEDVEADVALLKKLFLEEVQSDWTASQGSLEGHKEEYTFTETWQSFYLAEGLIKTISITDTDTGNKVALREKPTKVDENGNLIPGTGKYVTNITPYGCLLDLKDENGEYVTYDSSDPRFLTTYEEHYVTAIRAAQADQDKINGYIADGATEEEAKLFVTRDFAIDTVYKNYTAIDSSLIEIIDYWASGANLLDKFVAEARTEAYENLKQDDGSLAVKTISGIKADTTEIKGVKYDVLKIRINGIDPKAIYNFAFAVAPMSYYSGKYTNAKGVTKDYIKDAMDEMNSKPASEWTEFGVAFNDNKFFETVLQGDAKSAKPVGAGAYQVSNQKGDVGDLVSGSQFYSNNWVYFARNDYFENVGTTIENAKIKFLRYKVVNTDFLIEQLSKNEIDVGEPSATADNAEIMDGISHIGYATVDTNGYGYVGINPKYVPDIEVRQIIMGAMETSNCLTYYSEKYASLIYRSMSKASWVWKYEDMPEEPYYSLKEWNLQEIKDKLEGTQWTYNEGTRKFQNSKGETLKYTFTIAGATTDHPAYTMFMQAASILNDLGFDITVATDISALKKLSSGQLAVWAAAWSSTVDPDMYQVYHKDSNATSTKNWGYDTIFADKTGQFTYEQNTIKALSTLIENGRKTNDQEARASIYKQALDMVMQLAVEMPTYQRKDCVAYNKNIIDENSLNDKPTAFSGVIDKIWELDYV